MSARDQDFDSDDSDEDYTPDGQEKDPSEDESNGSGSEENEPNGQDDSSSKPLKKKRKARGKNGASRKRFRGDAKDSPEVPKWKEELVAAKKEEDEKAETDALWDDFLKDTTVPHPAGGPSKVENPAPSSVVVATSKPKLEVNDEERKSDGRLTSLFGEGSKNADIPVAGKPPTGRGSLLGGRPFIPTVPTRGRGRGLIAGGGITSILSSAKKVGVLEQSKRDWGAFKQQEGIVDELRQHAQSRNSYVEKQDFLSRVDHRQFEQEKTVREINRRRQKH